MLKVIIDYPKQEEEKLIIRQNINGEKFNVKPILKAEEIIEARKVVRQVYLDEKIERYIVRYRVCYTLSGKIRFERIERYDWIRWVHLVPLLI